MGKKVILFILWVLVAISAYGFIGSGINLLGASSPQYAEIFKDKTTALQHEGITDINQSALKSIFTNTLLFSLFLGSISGTVIFIMTRKNS